MSSFGVSFYEVGAKCFKILSGDMGPRLTERSCEAANNTRSEKGYTRGEFRGRENAEKMTTASVGCAAEVLLVLLGNGILE